jgi:hypothetical protein
MADPLYTQCDAIDADPVLTAKEKARQKASIKAIGLRDSILAGWTFPKTWSFSRNGHLYAVTIASVTVRAQTNHTDDHLQRDLLRFTGNVTRDGVTLTHSDGTPLFPIEIYNPPVLIAGGGGVVRGGRAFTYDLLALAQGVLGDVVAGV